MHKRGKRLSSRKNPGGRKFALSAKGKKKACCEEPEGKVIFMRGKEEKKSSLFTEGHGSGEKILGKREKGGLGKKGAERLEHGKVRMFDGGTHNPLQKGEYRETKRRYSMPGKKSLNPG